MTVTISSRKNNIQDNLSNPELSEDPVTDEFRRAHYGIVEPLTGDALDDECIKRQAEMNAAWKEAQK